MTLLSTASSNRLVRTFGSSLRGATHPAAFNAGSHPRTLRSWYGGEPPRPTLRRSLCRQTSSGTDTTTDPLAAVTDLVLVFGATVVIFDPYLPPDRRVQLLSDTIEVALTTGASEEDGREAHFASVFDEAADGLFVIVITPKA
jgi:hypothetical protein